MGDDSPPATDAGELRGEVDRFLATHDWHEPEALSLQGHVAWLRRYQCALHAAGLAVPSWPRRYGGRGCSAEATGLVEAWAAMWFLDRRIGAVVDDLEAGQVPGSESALTKRRLTIAEQSIFEAALASEGAGGMAGPTRWASGFLYSRSSSIYGGSQERQRNLIAERMLGLPRDPR